jgi:hypothetical protein
MAAAAAATEAVALACAQASDEHLQRTFFCTTFLIFNRGRWFGKEGGREGCEGCIGMGLQVGSGGLGYFGSIRQYEY